MTDVIEHWAEVQELKAKLTTANETIEALTAEMKIVLQTLLKASPAHTDWVIANFGNVYDLTSSEED